MPIRHAHGKQKIIAVVGPTASGKSALGVFLAQKIGGEIISADSRQVYKGLNIGTGKVTKKEMGSIPHHLLSIVSPKKQFTVDDFVKKGRLSTDMIYHTSQKVPIVVGGTGLYVDMLLGRMSYPAVPPNPKLRTQLEKKSVEKLFLMLKTLDPARAKTIEPKHKRRLIRAIEIAKGSKKNPDGDSRSATARARANFQQKIMRPPEGLLFAAPKVLWLGLNPKKLKKNIHVRLLSRLRSGMIKEAKKLHESGLSYKRMEALGLEYRYMALLLQNKITKKEMQTELERAIQKYAKRQSRWFRRNNDIRWIKNKKEALRLAKNFLGGR